MLSWTAGPNRLSNVQFLCFNFCVLGSFWGLLWQVKGVQQDVQWNGRVLLYFYWKMWWSQLVRMLNPNRILDIYIVSDISSALYNMSLSLCFCVVRVLPRLVVQVRISFEQNHGGDCTAFPFLCFSWWSDVPLDIRRQYVIGFSDSSKIRLVSYRLVC